MKLLLTMGWSNVPNYLFLFLYILNNAYTYLLKSDITTL